MSITAVPLQPTPKGTMIKLWVGVAACVALAGGLAWASTSPEVATVAKADCGANAFVPAAGGIVAPVTTPTGLRYQVVKAGAGVKPTDQDVVLVNYKGFLTDGKPFDAHDRAVFPVEGVVPGFSEGIKLMARGATYRFCIPSKLGYGDKSQPGSPIPAGSTLLFTVDLLDFKSQEEVARIQQQMQQQQMQAQQQAGASPAGTTTPAK